MMLNLRAFRLLSDPKLVSTTSVRFLFRVLRIYDLQTYRAVSLRRLLEEYKCRYKDSARCLEELARVGLLEIGPSAVVITGNVRSHCPTWRLGRPFLLTPKELAEWDADVRAEAERMLIAPPVGPNERPDFPPATYQ